MLPKKKRWAAALQSSNAQPNSGPSQSAMVRNQWVNQTATNNVDITDIASNLQSPSSAQPIGISTNANRTSNETALSKPSIDATNTGVKQVSSWPHTSTYNDPVVSILPTLGLCGINPIGNITGLFQQPGLFLQLCPSNYLTQNLNVTRSNQDSVVYNHHGQAKSGVSDLTGSQMAKYESAPATHISNSWKSRSDYLELHNVSRSLDSLGHNLHLDMTSNSSGQLNQAAASIPHHLPVPSRKSSCSDEQTVRSAVSPQTQHHTPLSSQQQLASGNLDFNTLSAVVRAVELLPPQQRAVVNAAVAAATGLTHWDNSSINAAHLPLSTTHNLIATTINNDRAPPIDKLSSRKQCSPSVSWSYSPFMPSTMGKNRNESPLTQPNIRSGVQSDQRVWAHSTDPTFSSFRSQTPTHDLLDPRRHLTKSTTSNLSTDVTGSKYLTNKSNDQTRSQLPNTTPWIGATTTATTTAVDSTSSHSKAQECRPDSVDAQSAILHDAKLTALSLDYRANSQQVTPGKLQRVRSSVSLSATMNSTHSTATITTTTSAVCTSLGSTFSPLASSAPQVLIHNSMHNITRTADSTKETVQFLSSTCPSLQLPAYVSSDQSYPLRPLSTMSASSCMNKIPSTFTQCSSPLTVVITSPSNMLPYPFVSVSSSKMVSPTAVHFQAKPNGTISPKVPSSVMMVNSSNNSRITPPNTSNHIPGFSFSNLSPTHCSYTIPAQSSGASIQVKSDATMDPSFPFKFHHTSVIAGATTTTTTTSSNSSNAVVIATGSHRHATSSFSMPLKKRLIQRYEADKSDARLLPNLLSPGFSKPELSSNSIKLIGEDVKRKNLINSEMTDRNQTIHEYNLISTEDAIKHSEEPLTSIFSERKGSSTSNKNSVKRAVLKHNKEYPANSNETEVSTKVIGAPSLLVKSGDKSILSDDLKNSRSRKSFPNSNNSVRRTRKIGDLFLDNKTDNESSLALNSSVPLKRRMTAVNGALIMMSTSKAQTSTSSMSADSSVRSGELNDGELVEEDKDEEVFTIKISDSPTTESNSAKTGNQVTDLEESLESGSNLNFDAACNRPSMNSNFFSIDRIDVSRKQKRAAAVAASVATAASAFMSVKRPRVTRHESRHTPEPPEKRRSTTRSNSYHKSARRADLVEDCDYRGSTNNASSVTMDSHPRKCVFDEMSVAVVEEEMQLGELMQQLFDPPDLTHLTDHSLRPAQSLDYYKRTQIPFVQLTSCNDPGLKQVPKCRACRQLKGPHFEAPVNNSNPLTPSNGAESHEDSVDSEDHQESANKSGRFKRPGGGISRASITPLTTPTNESSLNRTKRDSSTSAKDSSTSMGTSVANESTERSAKPNEKSSKSRKNAALSPVSVFCRFWGFRKLCFNNRGILKVADFCYSSEASPLDRALWEMCHPVLPPLSPEAAKYIVERASTLFCRLLRQELMFLTRSYAREPSNQSHRKRPRANISIAGKNGLRQLTSSGGRVPITAMHDDEPSSSVAWKRPVKGVREMCDVCETTMFNIHWVCNKCGYSVCLNCCEEAKVKKEEEVQLNNSTANSELKGMDDKMTSSAVQNDKGNGSVHELIEDDVGREKIRIKSSRTRGPTGWASCTTTRQHHDPGKLILTSLLPACIVGRLLHRVHRIARHYQIRMTCGCSLSAECSITDPNNNNRIDAPESSAFETHTDEGTSSESSLNLLADLALKTDNNTTTVVTKRIKHHDPFSLHGDVISAESDQACKLLAPSLSDSMPPHIWIYPSTAKHLTNTLAHSASVSPKLEQTVADAHAGHPLKDKYRVLQLYQPDGSGTMRAFQREWNRNCPIVVSGCQAKFDQTLWSPQSFAQDFGQLRTTLIDCATGAELTRYPLRTFFDGFERRTKRLMSKDGRSLCLKLKDWPTTDDFAELQPERFANLIDNLPMPDYTRREGQLNLAARLTSFFVCPDLGPKLYIAYGTAGSRSMATTNLHVDIADAVNVLLYVSQSFDSPDESKVYMESVLDVMRQSTCDPVYIDRSVNWSKYSATSGTTRPSSSVTEEGPGLPGALWHIFLPEDMPMLRQFLTQVTEEDSGAPLEPGSDPIHDQLYYLEQPLLDRLYACTGIIPCTLVQFLGDAVFIPAGAAHQVRNLNSCVKAAVDFVSPEHLHQCYKLIEEFRRLSPTHQNHEDKLQVKNMIFHGVKDALSVLLATGNSESELEELRRSSAPSVEFEVNFLSATTSLSHLSSPRPLTKKEEDNESELNRSVPLIMNQQHSSPSLARMPIPDLSSTRIKVKGKPGRPKNPNNNNTPTHVDALTTKRSHPSWSIREYSQ